MTEFNNYEQAEKYILDIPFFAKSDERQKSGNENLAALLDELGDPHKRIKSIHIAGTNGKGSVANFIKVILEEKGLRVGIFTSPHLTDIRERIVILDELITKEDFLACFNKVRAAEEIVIGGGGNHISFFEFMFAMAAVYYEIKKPDYVIYETGLGGRLDATNLLSPEIAVITSIGLDHMRYLGDTIESIAYEKAGIIKKGVPVVFNTKSDEADAVISKTAKSLDAEAINVAKTNYIINDLSDKTIDFSLSNSYYKYEHLNIRTSALYQVDNAITAIVVANRLLSLRKEAPLSEELIAGALRRFYWAGRMEYIYPNVCVDGAHNEAAIERFIESVNASYKDRDKYLLFAVAEDKNYRQMIRLLSEGLNPARVYITSIFAKRATDPKEIAEIFREYLGNGADIYDGVGIESSDMIRTAFEEAKKHEDKMLFCVGSLYLVGDIKRMKAEALI